MRILWVNHASFVLETGTIKLICDPWLEGTAFDNGWKLLSKTVLPYEYFSQITHIWFSHEHPDHFSPPNINKIPAEYRSRITVLYQVTADNKVKEFCLKAGFKQVIEMEPDTDYELSPEVNCLCNAFTHGDSYLYIKTPEANILNVNDCIITTPELAKEVKNRTGQVDILLTQFGYANKVGNREDTELRKEASREKLNRIRIHNEIFQPKTIIPFASFVYFCHEDNKYMNDGINKIDVVYDFVKNNLKKECVVLYPGESWEAGTVHDSDASVKKYMVDYDRLAVPGAIEYLQPKKIELPKLEELAVQFTQKLKSSNPQVNLSYFLPFHVYLADHHQAYSFSFKAGLKKSSRPEIKCDISMNSDVLAYFFTFLWGGGTMQVNARYQNPAGGNKARVTPYTELCEFTNQGIKQEGNYFFQAALYIKMREYSLLKALLNRMPLSFIQRTHQYSR